MSESELVPTIFTDYFRGYFGDIQGGANLKLSLESIPLNELQFLHESLQKLPENGRLFFIGNGGSFDNARIMALAARRAGFEARVPGNPDDFDAIINEHDYTAVFSESLKRENISATDIVIGVSGSGNSPNILKALSYSMAAGAPAFALGGRDGGKMKDIIEKGHTILASCNCMEAIEDTHNLMIQAVFKSLREETPLNSALFSLQQQFREFLNGNNYQKLGELAQGIVSAYSVKGRIFILGNGIGANHFRADLRRGATNTIPVRSLEIPELYTMNSFMATANDDGRDFGLAAGLMSCRPGPNDYALLFDEFLSPYEAKYCREVLSRENVPFGSISSNGIDLSFFEPDCMDFAITMIGHCSSVVLNEFFKEPFKIRELENAPGYPDGHKKLGIEQTLELEDRYRAAGIISANEVVTFSYGRVFAVSSPQKFERSFF